MTLIKRFKIPVMIGASLFTTSISFADNNDFPKGELAAMLTGQSITCEVKGGYVNGTATWIFTSIENNKLKGELDFHAMPGCSTNDLKGKLKKNRVKFFGNVKPNLCWGSISGYLDFFKGSDGNLEAEGFFRTTGPTKGSIKC